MPCLSYGYDEEPSRSDELLIQTLRADIAHLEAALCSALTFISSKDLMDLYYEETDWEEVGLPKKKVVSWWTHHRKKDAARRAQEKKAKEKEAKETAYFSRIRDFYSTLSNKPWKLLSTDQQQFAFFYTELSSKSQESWSFLERNKLKNLYRSAKTSN